MTRITRGVVKHRRHRNLLKLTKGHRGIRHRSYRRAHESLIHALQYSYEHRKKKKGDMRRLWNIRINAAARAHGMSYSQLIHGLRLRGIEVNRKMMAELAIQEPQVFSEVTQEARKHLEGAAS